jgi:hypothetical protein
VAEGPVSNFDRQSTVEYMTTGGSGARSAALTTAATDPKA